MKHPQVKKPRNGFQDTLLILRLFHVAPSLPEVASHVSMFVLAGSRRRSYQMAKNFPFSSEAMAGKNWSCGAGIPGLVVLRNCASDQVIPPSCESEIEMSAPDWARFTLFWYTYASVPVAGLISKPGPSGARNGVGPRWSSRFGLSSNCPRLSIRTGFGMKLAPPSADLLNARWRSRPVLQSSNT